MRQEIIDFYNSNSTPVAKLIEIGMTRKNLTKDAIEEALSAVYGDIMAGNNIMPVRIAWEVYARAKSLMWTVAQREIEYKALPWYRKVAVKARRLIHHG